MFYLLFCLSSVFFVFFFFNDTATTEIYTLSLHDALPIYAWLRVAPVDRGWRQDRVRVDRKSTRLNSSHTVISYAVFCLKKKKNKNKNIIYKKKKKQKQTQIQTKTYQ